MRPPSSSRRHYRRRRCATMALAMHVTTVIQGVQFAYY